MPEENTAHQVSRTTSGHFPKGVSGNLAGRPAGVENKLTRELKTMIREALELEGGVEYLRWAAREEPRAFLGLLARLLPAEINAAANEGQLVLEIRDFTGRGRARTDQPDQDPDSISLPAKTSAQCATNAEPESAETTKPPDPKPKRKIGWTPKRPQQQRQSRASL